MNSTVDVLKIVAATLMSEQRTLADLQKARAAHTEAASTLDPVIEKCQDLCTHLSRLNDDLRMSAVAART